MPQTPPVINRMIECLKKQKDCYVHLLKVARRQQKAIDERNDPDLLKALQEKNPLLQTLQTLDTEMQPVLKNLSESDRTLMIQKGKALKDEAAQTLEQLITVEDACGSVQNFQLPGTRTQSSRCNNCSYPHVDNENPACVDFIR